MKIKYITIILLTLLVIPLIQSAGVATSYWDSNPLKLAPGETTTVSVRLQNSETDSITLKASINSEIASLVDGPEYPVVKGTSVPVNIKVTIPQNVVIGTKYEVLISFQEISLGGGGMLSVAQGVTSKLPIEVVGLENSALREDKAKITGEATSGISSIINYLIAGILIIIVLIIIFIIKKNKKRPKQKTPKASS